MRLCGKAIPLLWLLPLLSTQTLFAAQASPQPDLAQSGVELAMDLSPCAFAKPPEILDARVISEHEMRNLGASVREYLSAMQDSLGCLESVEQNLSDLITDVQRATINAVYNLGVDKMNFISSEYNKQVNVFRIRDSIPKLEELRPLP